MTGSSPFGSFFGIALGASKKKIKNDHLVITHEFYLYYNPPNSDSKFFFVLWGGAPDIVGLFCVDL